MATEKKVLVAVDYVVFVIMLLLSVSIGVFFAIKDRRSKKGTEGYLMGGRKVSHWPVAMSLGLSFLSAVTVLGGPGEIYMFGSMYYWLLLAVPITVLVTSQMFIPFYYGLKLKTNFEYLGLRFNSAVRLIAIAAHIVQMIMYTGIMIYAPAVAITSVTTFNMWACILVTGLVCTFYTTLGGLKAVVWTDVFQGIILIAGTFVIMGMAAAQIPGQWDTVWKLNRETDRFDFFVFNADPRYRHTFWTVVVGLSFLWISILSTSQTAVQRFLCCRTLRSAQLSLYLTILVVYIVLTPLFILGWVMFAYFHPCDPLASGKVKSADQILPFMVMEVFENRPGLPGLFVASLFAACLSTVSSALNSLASITLNDFIRPITNWKENTYLWFSKGLACLFGLLCTGFACVSTLLSGVLQASLTVLGLVGGPLLAVFTLGMLFPCANWIGAISGFAVGIAIPTWIYIGEWNYEVIKYNPQYYRFKLRTISGCVAPTKPPINGSLLTTTLSSLTTDFTTELSVTDNMTTLQPAPPGPLPRPAIADNFYSLSYAYYTAIGFGACLIVGLIVSLIFYKHKSVKKVEPKYIWPIFDYFLFKLCLPKSFRRFMWCGVDHDQVSESSTTYPDDFKDKELPQSVVLANIVPSGHENKGYEEY